MKTNNLFLVLLFTFGILLTANAQNKNTKIIKATYVTTHLSDLMVDMLRGKILDPVQYSKMINDISSHKSYHILYKDVVTGESLFTLDSVVESPGLSVTGTNYFTYQENTTIIGKEDFLGKDFLFNGEANALKWEITETEETIGVYKCKKAILKSNPDIYVWFTTEVAVNAGPYIYSGLPGLVVKVNDLYKTTTLQSVSYQKDASEFENALEELGIGEAQKSISIEEVLAKKENFKQMILAGK